MNWTLRKKILIGYGIIIVLIGVVLIWSFVNLLGLGRASDAILRENYKSILAAENMIDAIERQDSAILLTLLGNNNEGLRQYRENESQFLQWLARAKDNITIEGEGEIISNIETGYTSYLTNFSNLRELHKAEPQQADAFYYETVLPLFKSVRDMCIHLREINQETMFQASIHTQQIAKRTIWSMVIIGLAAVGIGLGFSLYLSNLLVRPLGQIMEATKKLAEGTYDVKVTTDSSDELGYLSKEFNVMARKLKIYHDLNITEIVAEKQRSEAIIRSIDDGIVVVNGEFKITNINPIAAQIFDIEPDIVQGRHFLEVVKSEQLFNYVKQLVESGSLPSIEEGKNVLTMTQDKRVRHFMFSITPVHTKAGGMSGVVLLLRDVTKLKELDRLKSDFVMMTSHELRTPLTSIGMSIGLLEESAAQKLNEKEQKLLSAAHEESERLKVLVNDLLNLSKIEAGKIEMEFDSVPVRMLFEKVIASLKSQAEEKSIELSFKLPERLPKVKADANKVSWVLTNLISNALRYTGRQGHIDLFAEHIGSQVHISVRDNGTGIPYEYQSKIFDKFVRVKGAKEAGGSGLGLAISKEIVHAHRGTIWVDSTPGKGSTFTFTLPVVK